MSMQFCGLKMRQKNGVLAQSNNFCVHFFHAWLHPIHFRTFQLGDSVRGSPSCVNIYDYVKLFPKLQKLWIFEKNQQMANIQTHNSDIHGSTANDVYPHIFYST